MDLTAAQVLADIEGAIAAEVEAQARTITTRKVTVRQHIYSLDANLQEIDHDLFSDDGGDGEYAARVATSLIPDYIEAAGTVKSEKKRERMAKALRKHGQAIMDWTPADGADALMDQVEPLIRAAGFKPGFSGDWD